MKKEETKKKEFNPEELKEPLKKAYNDITKRNENAIPMGYVPKDTRLKFCKWADKKFGNGEVRSGHYGYALMFLWDFYNGEIKVFNELLEQKLVDIENEIKELKESVKND